MPTMTETILINIIAAVPPTIGSILAYRAARYAHRASKENAQKIQDVHVSINSRLDNWLARERRIGKEEGRAAEVQRIADEKKEGGET